MHSLFTLSFLLKTLHEAGKITQVTIDAVSKYISACQINTDGSFINSSTKKIGEDMFIWFFLFKHLIYNYFVVC